MVHRATIFMRAIDELQENGQLQNTIQQILTQQRRKRNTNKNTTKQENKN